MADKKERKPRTRRLIRYRLDILGVKQDKSDPAANWMELEVFDSHNDARKFAGLHNEFKKGSHHYSITKVITIREPKDKGTSREII